MTKIDRWYIIRCLIVLSLISILLVLGYLVYFLEYFLDVNLDWGGVFSLIATIILLFIVGLDQEIRKLIVDKTYDSFWTVILLITASVGSIGVWLTIRVILLNLKILLFQESYRYRPSAIFSIISFILAANLCFTLLRAFKKIATAEIGIARELVRVAIQVVIISFIALLPRYNITELLMIIGGFGNFLVLLVTLIGVLTVLVFLYKSLSESETLGSARR